MERSVSVRWTIALVGLGCCLLAASAMASGASRRHSRTHRVAVAAPASSSTPSPTITLTPTSTRLVGTGAFTASISGDGFPSDMPVTINTSTLDAVCSAAKTGSPNPGVATSNAIRAGIDGRWAGSLAGLDCRPGVYAVAVQEQALPYQTFVATVTLTL